MREGGDTLHVVHICCRKGGPSRPLGKDRCRALHVEPPHAIPQTEGKNQKLPYNKNPYSRLKAQSRLAGWVCVSRGGEEAEALCCWLSLRP